MSCCALLAEAEVLERDAAAWRLRYYQKLLPRGGRRLLDLGCGNGYAVAAWHAEGLQSFGVDISTYRLARWVEQHRQRRPFVLADARHLPFRDGTFDTVISSGMIEHVGVRESVGPYTVEAEADQEVSRQRVLEELARIVGPDGVSYLDFPNGSFPIDFWHGDRLGALRWHPIPDALLPRYSDVRRWAERTGLQARLEALTGRLAFKQVGRRWWGRLLARPVALGLRIFDAGVRRGWSGIPARLFPYLVISLRRR